MTADQIGDQIAAELTGAITERLPRDLDDVTVADVADAAADFLLDTLIDIYMTAFDRSTGTARGPVEALADVDAMRDGYHAALLAWKFDMEPAVRRHLRACLEVH